MVIIKTLIENTALSPEYQSEHGLSLYIATTHHKILFDLGASGLFLTNARRMGVPIEEVDTVIISHGHNDHGGGLDTFLKVNDHAKIYIQEKALGAYFAHRPGGAIVPIGLKRELLETPRVILTATGKVIDQELELFSGIKAKAFFPYYNRLLMMEKDGQTVPDTFDHEQNLIITDNGITILLAGCAHNGIINIIGRFKELKGRLPDVVIGGFHLSAPSAGKTEKPEDVEKLAIRLAETNIKFYTCHCTGQEAYAVLKERLQEQIGYLSAGSELIL